MLLHKMCNFLCAWTRSVHCVRCHAATQRNVGMNVLSNLPLVVSYLHCFKKRVLVDFNLNINNINTCLCIVQITHYILQQITICFLVTFLWRAARPFQMQICWQLNFDSVVLVCPVDLPENTDVLEISYGNVISTW